MSRSIILLSLYCVSTLVVAQTTNPGKVQVVTKLVQKSISAQPNQNLQIDAKRAKVILSPSTDNQIHLKLSLIAKHTQREKAEKDLQALTYEISTQGQDIVIKNQIDRNKINERITSLLKTIYEIQLPTQIPITVKQNYGEVQIDKIKSPFTLQCDYTEIKLTQAQSEKAEIRTNYSDVTLKGCSGKFNISSNYGKIEINQSENMDLTGNFNYGEISIQDFSGEINLNANHSEIEITGIKDAQKVNIVSNYTDIEFKNAQSLSDYGFDIAGHFSDIEIAEPLKKDFVRSSNKLFKNASKNAPVIRITVNHGDIEVE
ncbi:MAG: DUF4097 family beta strand repeat-containing protein [Bacteroidia bacterium]|nr:DUF4097 family beta strand repeat-containing protein [Bacteroidia bacterium]